jgi:caffeoyl-CoA O-methyltransferase
MNRELFASVDLYISDLLAPEDEALLAVGKSQREANIPFISISANQGKFLYTLALLCNARRILELGTLAGYSAIWMARALPQDGQLITIELEQNHAEVARRNIANAGLADKVEVRVGKALDLLKELEDTESGTFDMIFIDADKPPYTEYFLSAVKLASPGALIVVDNVIREGKVLEHESDDEKVRGVQRFNNMLANNPDVTATILQTIGIKEHDGMAIAVVNRK